jgi:hypothetical protein
VHTLHAALRYLLDDCYLLFSPCAHPLSGPGREGEDGKGRGRDSVVD